MIQILMFVQWTVSVVFLFPTDTTGSDAREIALKYSHQFFPTITYSNAAFTMNRAFRSLSFNVSLHSVGRIFFFAQISTHQILCFTVFLCVYVGVVSLWGCVQTVNIIIVFFFMAPNGNNGPMKIESKKKSKSRKRKCGQITRDKVKKKKKMIH